MPVVAKKKTPIALPQDASALAELIIDTPIEEELSGSYLEYALSVIVSRAIPDARDGLKPVQRRILYAMSQAHLSSDKPYRKSIAAVGDTMKKFHPHGDAAIYETLVRLSQSWVMNAPLVDGHGNFGSLDDGPAASRYTEARLSKLAELLLADVDENTVDMSSNFDASTFEPVVLPAAFPNLLVNGASGIAVGMATNMAPHNLTEVIAACQLLLKKPKATLNEVLEIMPGPDFPTGGTLLASKEQLREMYATGRGSFKVRARVSVEEVRPRKLGLIVTQLPYNVGPEKVIARVKELVAAKRLDGISDIADHTDRKHGMRLVIEVKNGFVPELVLENLYKLTPLEESFSTNSVALVDYGPRQCDLLLLLRTFLAHRQEVIVRRSKYRLKKAEQRVRMLGALIAALDNIDEVVRIIRSSKDTESARKKLCSLLSIDTEQANHVLDMPLRRLTTLESRKLKDDLAEQELIVKSLTALLASEKDQLRQVAKELAQVQSDFGTPRKSIIISEAPIVEAAHVTETLPDDTPSGKKTGSTKALVASQAADVPCSTWVTLDGHLRSGTLNEAAVLSCATTTLSSLVLFDDRGYAHLLPVADAAHAPLSIDSVLPKGRSLVGMFPVGTQLAIGTSLGLVKRLDEETPTLSQLGRAKDGLSLISLKDGDFVVSAQPCGPDSEIIFVTSAGQLLRSRAAQVRPQGKTASGVSGVKLKESEQVIAFAVLPPDSESVVAVSTDQGNAKVSRLVDYPILGRSTAGVRVIAFKKSDTRVSVAAVGTGLPVMLNSKGKRLDLDSELARRDASGKAMSAPASSCIFTAAQ
mgnify:CR=1 FL=1